MICSTAAFGSISLRIAGAERTNEGTLGRQQSIFERRPEASMRDLDTVAGIVNALRQVCGDDIARFMLNDGLSLAALIDALLRSPLKNHDAVKLITRALSSGDFIVTPDFGSPSHLKYFYDRPKSMHVVDIAAMTLDHGAIASTDIHLRPMPSGN
jgi:hypothetical protein